MRMRTILATAALATVTVIGGATAAVASPGPDAGAHAKAVAAHSPGLLSGNVIQVPVNVDLNLCGNTVNVVGLLNPAVGNKCRAH
ncbi:chaplin [Streptomyces sp. NPDC005863]|uniref:chaplin n=1 Tax=unclassified Streptomyces TaxID=2593676 RepID=UPI0033ED8860